jgi:hypothetical protein
MNINLHIEHLVLDGLPLTSRQGRAVQGELECELARLLEQHGLGRVSGAALSSLSVAPIQLSPGGEPLQWGRQIARALYAGLAPPAQTDSRQQKARSATTAPFTRKFAMNPVSQNHPKNSRDSNP